MRFITVAHTLGFFQLKSQWDCMVDGRNKPAGDSYCYVVAVIGCSRKRQRDSLIDDKK